MQLELAKNILAQLPAIKLEAEKAAAIKKATDALSDVVRYYSPYKAEALEILRKYKPKVAVDANEVVRLSYDDAVTQGEEAIGAEDWDRAIALMNQAVRRAQLARDTAKMNYARYNLAFCDYKAGRHYEAAVLADHLARFYPRESLSARATEIGMAALVGAYNTNTQVDRASDLDRLIELARYTAETYSENEHGDSARMTLGQIYQGTGRYAEAVEAYESVRPKSPRRLDAIAKAGSAHWDHSLALRRAGKTTEADAEVEKAIATLRDALTARREAGAAASDPGVVDNACDLADVYLETGKPAEAVALLEPIAKDQDGLPLPEKERSRLTTDLLRAHIGANQVDQAIADMAALEKSGGQGGRLTQLYYKLGKLLETETEALEKKGDRTKVERHQGVVSEIPDRSGQQQVGPDLRVARMGRRKHAQAGQSGRGREGLQPDLEDV